MLAAINFKTNAIGGNLLLLVWSTCTAAYLVCGLLQRRHWKEKSFRWLLAGLLTAELLVDTVCFLAFFPGGEYHNWGIGGAYVAGLWPLTLLAAYVFTAILDGKRCGAS